MYTLPPNFNHIQIANAKPEAGVLYCKWNTGRKNPETGCHCKSYQLIATPNILQFLERNPCSEVFGTYSESLPEASKTLPRFAPYIEPCKGAYLISYTTLDNW